MMLILQRKNQSFREAKPSMLKVIQKDDLESKEDPEVEPRKLSMTEQNPEKIVVEVNDDYLD